MKKPSTAVEGIWNRKTGEGLIGAGATADIDPVDCTPVVATGWRLRTALVYWVITISILALASSYLQGGSAASAVANFEVIRPQFFIRCRTAGYPQASVAVHLIYADHIRVKGLIR